MEIEAKFLANAKLLKVLTSAGEIAGCPITRRSWMRLETTYYDTADQRLAKQASTLRLRRGETGGTLLSFKKGRAAGGISRWEEAEVTVPADYDPARPAFRPQPFLVAEWVAGGRSLAPVLTLTMDRTVLVIISGSSRLNLCLDRVSRPDRPDWQDYEIEVELDAGPEAGLADFAQTFQREYSLKPSASSKIERAMLVAAPNSN